jgi:EAL domain-containing protein (putative c-di-GMP-specific phosphodiesterase class I)
VYPDDGDDAGILIKNADIAMYRAKGNGKNQYMLCNTDMKDEVNLKTKLSNSLYRALERDEFILYYQPQVYTGTNAIIGLEALLRWQHPEYGLIMPGLFISLAEQTGLIGAIGQWVLRRACRQCKSWHDSGLPDIRISVNVSTFQFRNSNLSSQVSDALKETGLDPKYLDLEITESIAMTEDNYILDVLNSLKDLGVSVTIDDFGTDYSSLSRLNILPIDRLKLDIQFIRNIGKSHKDNAIIKGIIDLAHNLELKVLAEGVEEEPQLSFLRRTACDEIQGFYFSRPISADETEIVLRNNLQACQ